MERSLRFVLAGTFTLRFSTGLTGAMLCLYLASLPAHSSTEVDARLVGLFPTAFFLNAAIYGVSFLIYKYGVKDPAGEAEAVASPHVGVHRYLQLIRSAHVLLLAPTWIAVNASIGLWFSQSLFQFSKTNPKF